LDLDLKELHGLLWSVSVKVDLLSYCCSVVVDAGVSESTLFHCTDTLLCNVYLRAISVAAVSESTQTLLSHSETGQ